MRRYLADPINQFSQEKFVLLAGPRQVGKTTLAKEWLVAQKGRYLNWDAAEDRELILKKQFVLHSAKDSAGPKAIVLDEIHKYPRWKTYLKGLFDKEAGLLKVVVTGSARLDLYRKGGDSLFGRYELLRLHPLSIGELVNKASSPPPKNWLNPGNSKSKFDIWNQLLEFGGFPEPYYAQDARQHRRWSIRRRELLIKEDIRDISDIRLVELVEHLYLLLPERIGSPLSINSLHEGLSAAFNSVANWLSALERLYICFRISPYHKKLARSLKKEQKLYLWDWSQIPNPAARFENIVACHLLKAINYWNDLGFGEFDLFYWRNKEKEEVDFIITQDRKLVVLFECKYSDEQIAKPLQQLSAALGNLPAIQLVAKPEIDYTVRNCRVVSADKYLGNLV